MAGMFDIFRWGLNPRPIEEIAKESQYGTPLTKEPVDSSSMISRYNMVGRQSRGGPIPIPQQNQGALQPNAQGANITMADGASLAKWAGLDLKQLERNWKDKGGFEGLMANPAFSLGLAMIQSSAQGKRIDEALMNNFVKAAGISAQFKDRIAARAGGVIEATEGQMNEIKQVLGTKGISAPILRRLKPGNQSESYEQAVEDIAVKVQKKVNAMKKQAKASGKDIVVGKRLYKKIIDDMIESKEINKVGGFKLFGYNIWDATLETPKPMAKGGPITKGKPYIVGEKGPEVVIPRQSGKVVSNDDARIFAMLLAANPQLQKVSKARAEKIIRARFPEYFEV